MIHAMNQTRNRQFAGPALLITITAGLAWTTQVRATSPGQGEGIDPVLAKRYFDEVRALSDIDGGKLWGRRLYGPFMFADPASRTVVANEADAEGRLRQEGEVFIGELPLAQNLGNTAFDWAGKRWTMVLWPPFEDRFARARLLTHELFHRIQGQIGLAPAAADNGHLDTRDGRIWLRLEWRALSEALTNSGEARTTAIRDALLFRRYRQTIFPDRADDERAFEMHEGMAEYTGFRTCGMIDAALAGMAAVQIDAYEQRSPIVMTFAYASGPAYGILLDRAGADWRPGVSPETDLSRLLQEAHKIELPSDLKAEAQGRSVVYDGPKVVAEEDQREGVARRQRAAYHTRFVDGPVLVLPALDRTNYAYNPNRVSNFGERGQVFEVGRITDGWGVLEVQSGGVWLVRTETGGIEKVVVPAPAEPDTRPVQGDGWTLALEPGWTLLPAERTGDFVVDRQEE